MYIFFFLVSSIWLTDESVFEIQGGIDYMYYFVEVDVG